MTFATMRPETSIGPTTIIRRAGKARWHLAEIVPMGAPSKTACGQTIRGPEAGVAYNAEQITCDDCLVSAVSRGQTGSPAELEPCIVCGAPVATGYPPEQAGHDEGCPMIEHPGSLAVQAQALAERAAR